MTITLTVCLNYELSHHDHLLNFLFCFPTNRRVSLLVREHGNNDEWNSGCRGLSRAALSTVSDEER